MEREEQSDGHQAKAAPRQPRWRSVEESDMKLEVPLCRSFPAEVRTVARH
jgi:hypothetical protein